ncbi:MAG: hypothetical protein AAF604_20260 [Acidobacteriota bacterium]
MVSTPSSTIPRGRGPFAQNHWLGQLVLAAMLGLLALAVSYPQTFLASETRVPGNCGDSRFNHFLLEHTWGWLRGEELHRELWDLPIFYPAVEDTYAHSDLLLSLAPPYWLARALGQGPEGAFRSWLFAVLWLNYLAAFFLLRRGCGAGTTAAALGAFLIAFPISRLHQTPHPQLLPCFFVLLALWAVIAYGKPLVRGQRDSSPGRPWPAIVTLVLASVAQLYGGFYFGFFWGLILAGVLAAVLLVRSLRGPLLRALRRDLWVWLGAGVGGALLLVPLVSHYAAVAGRSGVPSWNEVAQYLPRPVSWIFVSDASHLYGWMKGTGPFGGLPAAYEQAIGIGLLTTLMMVGALFLRRRHPAVQVLLLVTGGMVLLTTIFFGQQGSLWRLVYALHPGLAATRAICRVGVLVLPLAAGLSLPLLLAGQRGWRWGIGAVLGLLCCAEQLGVSRSYDPWRESALVATMAEQVDPDFPAFLVSQRGGGSPGWLLSIDAMWAAEAAGVPTVNGYSGRFPAGWSRTLGDPKSGTRPVRQELRMTLARWLEDHGADPWDVQLLQVPANYRKRRGRTGRYCF